MCCSARAAARSTDAIKQLEAAGCTVQKVAALPSGDHSVLTPGGTSKKWNTDPPTNGPHYQQCGDLGRVHDAALPGAGRAQPRARRHLHPVRQGRAAGHGRPAEGVLRPAPERDAARAAAEARLEDRAGRVDDQQPDVSRTPAPRTSRSARRSTRAPTRRSSRRTSSRAPSASRPTRSRPARRSPDDRLKPVAAAVRRPASAGRSGFVRSTMPGLGLEPRRPEGHPILSRARMTSFATPAFSRARDGEAYRASSSGQVGQDIAGVSSSAPTRSGMRIGFVT